MDQVADSAAHPQLTGTNEGARSTPATQAVGSGIWLGAGPELLFLGKESAVAVRNGIRKTARPRTNPLPCPPPPTCLPGYRSPRRRDAARPPSQPALRPQPRRRRRPSFRSLLPSPSRPGAHPSSPACPTTGAPTTSAFARVAVPRPAMARLPVAVPRVRRPTVMLSHGSRVVRRP